MVYLSGAGLPMKVVLEKRPLNTCSAVVVLVVVVVVVYLSVSLSVCLFARVGLSQK